jgi:pullulanase
MNENILSEKQKYIVLFVVIFLLVIQLFLPNQEDKYSTIESSSELLPQVINIPIYLRGSMNEWGTIDEFSANKSNSEFTLVYDFEPGSYEFKVADASWNSIDLGGDNSLSQLKLGEKYPLKIRGDNIKIDVPHKQTLVFILSGQSSEQMSLTLFKAQSNS